MRDVLPKAVSSLATSQPVSSMSDRMDLLALMYHHGRAGPYGNAPDMLDRHFHFLREHCHVILPGEPGVTDRLNVCLTFDDAYFDFYAIVYPLLQKHDLRAVLGVPVSFIVESVSAPFADRLAIENNAAFAEPGRGGFCTWAELEELAASGRVEIASHGYTHIRLDRVSADLRVEIDMPATLLRARLKQPVDTFIFPYGRYDTRSLDHAARQYRHVFRIGGALNRDWNSQPLYRVDGDQMASPTALFSARHLAIYRARRIWNRLRGR